MKKKQHLMAMFMEIKSFNQKLGEHQISKELGRPSSILQQYRHDIYMLSTYRTSSNSHKRRQKISSDSSNSEHDISEHKQDLKRPQKTSKRPQKIEVIKPESNLDTTINHTLNKKRKLKGRSSKENHEINDDC